MNALADLLKPEFRSYQIISGRDGLLGQAEVKAQLKVLEKIAKQLEKFNAQPLRNEDIQKAASHILKDCAVPKAKELQNLQRARYGIAQYLRRTTGAQLEQPSAF